MTYNGEFKNKVAVVTGGSRGIGRAVAKRLSETGARVVITYNRDASAADEVVKQINNLGGDCYGFQNDNGKFDDVKELVRTIKKEIGEIDYLVNNAGIGINKSFYLMSEPEWDQVIRTNLNGVFNFCRNVVVDFLKRKGGNIVNIASVAGFKGLPGQVGYCASKAGIINLTRSLAREVGRAGIRVNAVAPGYINTDMTKSMNAQVSEKYKEQIPGGEFGEPDDVANVVLFLLSATSRYIQGETIVADGGLSL